MLVVSNASDFVGPKTLGVYIYIIRNCKKILRLREEMTIFISLYSIYLV